MTGDVKHKIELIVSDAIHDFFSVLNYEYKNGISKNTLNENDFDAVEKFLKLEFDGIKKRYNVELLHITDYALNSIRIKNEKFELIDIKPFFEIARLFDFNGDRTEYKLEIFHWHVEFICHKVYFKYLLNEIQSKRNQKRTYPKKNHPFVDDDALDFFFYAYNKFPLEFSKKNIGGIYNWFKFEEQLTSMKKIEFGRYWNSIDGLEPKIKIDEKKSSPRFNSDNIEEVNKPLNDLFLAYNNKK
jgi:hypothetical protein